MYVCMYICIYVCMYECLYIPGCCGHCGDDRDSAASDQRRSDVCRRLQGAARRRPPGGFRHVQRSWYVLSCQWDGAYKRTLAANRKE